MDSNARENCSSKAEFRKPSNDTANRKYRRRSPVPGSSSSSSDGSPPRDHSSSLVQSRKDTAKVADDGKRDKSMNRQSYKSYRKDDKRVDDYDRGYSKPSYHSSRDSRDNSHSDYSRTDREIPSRDYVKGVDTYSHVKSGGLGYRSKDKDSYDRAGSGRRHADTDERERDRDRDRRRDDRGERYGRKDYKKSSMDHKGHRSPAYEESRAQKNDYSSRRDNYCHRLKESSSRDSKEDDANNEKRWCEDVGSHKMHVNSDKKEISEGRLDKSEEAVAKKPKTFSTDITNAGPVGPSEKAYVMESDIDAAKIAAMKAAELVNKNLIGTGCMTADQKKKLLWGNKNTSAEEHAHRWDTTMFGDRERQEKFNKLMGVKEDHPKVEPKLDHPDVEKQRDQLQIELERQYTVGLRRRDGRTVGLGL